jgi:hypothetical protein
MHICQAHWRHENFIFKAIHHHFSNLKFQHKPKYHVSKILILKKIRPIIIIIIIGPKSHKLQYPCLGKQGQQIA